MLEKIMEKIAFVEVMKDVAEQITRLKESYQSAKESCEKTYNECEEENYWKKSYLKDIEEYDRKISAIDKISEFLLKMM